MEGGNGQLEVNKVDGGGRNVNGRWEKGQWEVEEMSMGGGKKVNGRWKKDQWEVQPRSLRGGKKVSER
jgi:hypothetical protein